MLFHEHALHENVPWLCWFIGTNKLYQGNGKNIDWFPALHEDLTTFPTFLKNFSLKISALHFWTYNKCWLNICNVEVENIQETIWNILCGYWWLKQLFFNRSYSLHDYTDNVKI